MDAPRPEIHPSAQAVHPVVDVTPAVDVKVPAAHCTHPLPKPEPLFPDVQGVQDPKQYRIFNVKWFKINFN